MTATTFPEFTLAAIQAAPVLLDRDASTDKACRLIEEAADLGATIAAFGETWLPGYPFFTHAAPSPLWWKAAAAYLASSIIIPSPTTDRLCETARRCGVDVVIGVVERDPNTHGSTYCTLLFIGREGKILGRHRKLKPTHNERSIWGEGDTVGLMAHERPYARISGLNCWEHQMMLPSYALAAQGTQIHIAAWPGRESDAPEEPVSVWTRQLLLSRAFASQTGSYVIAVGGVRHQEDIPKDFDALCNREFTGDSYIIDPRGEIIAGPAEGETILIAKGSLEAVMAAKVGVDIAGHYSRPDQLQLHVDGQPLERIRRTSQRTSDLAQFESEQKSDEGNSSIIEHSFGASG